MIDEVTMEVGYEEKNSSSSNQMWNLSQEQENGWRNIVHTKSGLYLTVLGRDKGSVLKLQNKVVEKGQILDIHNVALHPHCHITFQKSQWKTQNAGR